MWQKNGNLNKSTAYTGRASGVLGDAAIAPSLRLRRQSRVCDRNAEEPRPGCEARGIFGGWKLLCAPWREGGGKEDWQDRVDRRIRERGSGWKLAELVAEQRGTSWSCLCLTEVHLEKDRRDLRVPNIWYLAVGPPNVTRTTR